MSDLVRVLDWRARQTDVNREDACAMMRGKVIMRPLGDVLGITLHQTAAYFSVAPYQLKAAGGDEQLARHTRFLDPNAHSTAGRHGKVVIAHDPAAYVFHGHQLSSFTVGQEHELLCDADGNAIRPPKGWSYDEVIEAGRAGLTWYAENLPNLKFVYAHRQAYRKAKGAKTRCCGARIFKEVGVEHGVKKLGLTTEPNRIWGGGKALPSNWYM